MKDLIMVFANTIVMQINALQGALINTAVKSSFGN